ncbi:polyprenyl diphosphate synthase [Pleionea sp. CnH1-48]|uniref:polyprenyl diphosphate synthase n=1 Tax=Pleionea sp. CnH1-48 TaxID=2954494 RepID=UPI00209786F9|nr:polyprenyl diphosphate synthase [Pleionea sp. CnH1-48]
MTENLTIPQHIAVIMDGNGRWAEARGKKRVQGHKEGVERARDVIQQCGKMGVKVLTLFAFSSENWKRPESEVSFLMNLFITALSREAKALNKNNVRLKVIGDVSRFDEKLQKTITKAEDLTADNSGLLLQIAANYGGQWDILNAVNTALSKREGSVADAPLTQQELEDNLITAGAVFPDLMIRTGGEHRISNFLLWQAAYSELYFADHLWPDFGVDALMEAINDFSRRQRRFGLTGEQVESKGTE